MEVKQAIRLNALWNPLEAILILDNFLVKKPQHCEALYTIWCSYMLTGNIGVAISYFDKALTIKKKDYILAGKWDCLGSIGKDKEAIKCFDEALRLNRKNSLTYSSKWYSLMGLKKYKEALKCLNTALELNPNNYWAQQCINIIHQKHL